MAVERFDLPAGPAGEEQFVMRQTVPSGGEMRQMEREGVKVMGEGLRLPMEDILIAALVKSWQVVTRDGETITSLERRHFGDLPESTLVLISDDLNQIIDRVRPANAAQDILTRMVSLTQGMRPDDSATIARIATEFAEVMGIGGPNPDSQAA